MGKFKEAKIQFKNVLQLNPKNWQAYYYLGQLYLQKDQLEKAQTHLEYALAINAGFADAINSLGIIQLRKNQAQLAIDYFAQALAQDNDHIEARQNIAATFMQYDRYQNAITHYQELLQRQADHLEAHFNIAVAFMTLGKTGQAIHHYHQVLKQQANHIDARINLGTIYISMGQIEQAKQHFEQVLTIDPEHRLVNYHLSALKEDSQQTSAPRDYVENLFNNYAFHYEQHLIEQLAYQVPRALINLFKVHYFNGKDRSVSSNLHILDLGCGTGLAGSAVHDFAQSLTGVDLSEKMLAIAKNKDIYTTLIHADIVHMLQTNQHRYDLIIAADVFPYIGDLKEILTLCKQHLSHDGLLLFSSEQAQSGSYMLQRSARFAHSSDYIHELSQSLGLTIEHQQTVVGRKQQQKAVHMNLFVLGACTNRCEI